MRFEERDEGGQHRRIVRPAFQFIRPDSGQSKEPLRPTLVNKRCRERGKREGDRIDRFLLAHGVGNCG